MEIYSIVSIVIEAKERTRGKAGGGEGGGAGNVIFFLAHSSLCRAHNLKTWAFNVCLMKAVVCCPFL